MCEVESVWAQNSFIYGENAEVIVGWSGYILYLYPLLSLMGRVVAC